MGEGALKIISCTKIRSCYMKNIAPRYFTYYCVLIFLISKSYFQIQPSVDRIIFSKIPLPVCLLILCSFQSSSSASKLFFIRTSKVLMRLTDAKCSYYVLIFYKNIIASVKLLNTSIKYLSTRFLMKIIQRLKLLTIFAKKLHHRYLKGS